MLPLTPFGYVDWRFSVENIGAGSKRTAPTRIAQGVPRQQAARAFRQACEERDSSASTVVWYGIATLDIQFNPTPLSAHQPAPTAQHATGAKPASVSRGLYHAIDPVNSRRCSNHSPRDARKARVNLTRLTFLSLVFAHVFRDLVDCGSA